jgi:hypothetical protein
MADYMALDTGELFAQRYVIDRALGEGDRKKTYLARDRKMAATSHSRSSSQKPCS